MNQIRLVWVALGLVFSAQGWAAKPMVDLEIQGGTLIVKVADSAAVAKTTESIWVHQVEEAFAPLSKQDLSQLKTIHVEIENCDGRGAVCQSDWLAPGAVGFEVFSKAMQSSAFSTLESLADGDPILEQLLRGVWNGAKLAVQTYDLSWWTLGGFAAGFLAGGPAATAVYVAKIVQFLSRASMAYLAIEITEAIAHEKYEQAGELFGQALVLYAVSSGGYKAGNKARAAIEKQRERIVMAQTQAASKATAQAPRPAPSTSRPSTNGGRKPNPRGPVRTGSTRSPSTQSRPTPRQQQDAWDRLDGDAPGGGGGGTAVAEAPPRTRTPSTTPRPSSRPSGSRTTRSPSTPSRSPSRALPPAPTIHRLQQDIEAITPRAIQIPLTPLPTATLPRSVTSIDGVSEKKPTQGIPSNFKKIELEVHQKNHELAAYRLYRLLNSRAKVMEENLGFIVPEVRLTLEGDLFRPEIPVALIQPSAIPSDLIVFDWLVANPSRSVALNVGVSSAATGNQTISKDHADAFQIWDSQTWLASTELSKVRGHTPYARPIRWINARSAVPELVIYRVLSQIPFSEIRATLSDGEESLLTESEMYKLYQRYLTIVWIKSLESPADARIILDVQEDTDLAGVERYLRRHEAPTTTFEVIQKILNGETIMLGADLGVDAALNWLRQQCKTKSARDTYPPSKVCEKLAEMFDDQDHRLDTSNLWEKVFEGARKNGSGKFDYFGTEISYAWDGSEISVYEKIPPPASNVLPQQNFVASAKYLANEDAVEFKIFLRENVSRRRIARSRYLYGREALIQMLGFLEQELGHPIRRVRANWFRDSGEQMDRSDNFDAFQKYIRTMSRESAAKSTWTGKLLVELGYTQVREIVPEQSPDEADPFDFFGFFGPRGRPSRSERVEFMFSKPE